MMTYSLGQGESVHNPGAITLGLLTDLGWNSGTIGPPPSDSCPSAPTAVQLQSASAGATNTNSNLYLSFFVLLAFTVILTGYQAALKE
jgi:hypothetical protein